jgi:hypothetical protein
MYIDSTIYRTEVENICSSLRDTHQPIGGGPMQCDQQQQQLQHYLGTPARQQPNRPQQHNDSGPPLLHQNCLLIAVHCLHFHASHSGARSARPTWGAFCKSCLRKLGDLFLQNATAAARVSQSGLHVLCAETGSPSVTQIQILPLEKFIIRNTCTCVCEIESFIRPQTFSMASGRSFATLFSLVIRLYTHGCAPLGLT